MSMKAIIPEGYKKTKVGIIPNDWNIYKMDEVFYEVNEKVGNQKIDTYSISAGIGYVSQKEKFGKDISGSQNENYVVLDNNQFAYNKGNSKTYQYGCIYPNNTNRKIAVPNVFISFDFRDKAMSVDYYAKLFENHFLDRELRKIISSSARMDGLLNINKKYFFEIPIVCPPLKEQQKIAEILTTWDEAITKQEQLIKEKEQLKKGLMQNLLSGKVRFSGFSDEWETIKLKEIIIEYADRNNQDLHEVVSVGKYGLRKRTEIYSKDLSQDISKNKVITKNTLSIGMGSTQIDIGILKTDNVYSVSPAYSTFRIVNVNAYFLEQLLLIHNKKLSNLYMITGARQGKSVNKEDFLNHIFSIPSKIEQQKIAEVLSLADSEINLLKNELEELRLQKKALMQKLLTGQVRVKI